MPCWTLWNQHHNTENLGIYRFSNLRTYTGRKVLPTQLLVHTSLFTALNSHIFLYMTKSMHNQQITTGLGQWQRRDSEFPLYKCSTGRQCLSTTMNARLTVRYSPHMDPYILWMKILALANHQAKVWMKILALENHQAKECELHMSTHTLDRESTLWNCGWTSQQYPLAGTLIILSRFASNTLL
jgi:hypothetical protein